MKIFTQRRKVYKPQRNLRVFAPYVALREIKKLSSNQNNDTASLIK